MPWLRTCEYHSRGFIESHTGIRKEGTCAPSSRNDAYCEAALFSFFKCARFGGFANRPRAHCDEISVVSSFLFSLRWNRLIVAETGYADQEAEVS